MWLEGVHVTGGENAGCVTFSAPCDSSHRRAAVKIPAARNMLKGAEAEHTIYALNIAHVGHHWRPATLI